MSLSRFKSCFLQIQEYNAIYRPIVYRVKKLLSKPFKERELKNRRFIIPLICTFSTRITLQQHYESILISFLLSKSLQDELNRQILEGLLHFIRRCSGPRHTVGPWEARMRASEIPTAALVLGK